MFARTTLYIAPAVFAVYMPMCAPRIQPSAQPWDVHLSELWQKPIDLAERDLYYGPWGPERAPNPHATYTFVEKKRHGTNPGVIVKDPEGHEWHVKQPPMNDQGAEGPIEVVLSRVLSAVGYRQPPVYFVQSFTMADASGTTRTEAGGRFRLHLDSMHRVGDWSWQQNQFVGAKPYQGLLVILMMFNSSDLKNDNNTLYAVTTPDGATEPWHVVRDLGTALGDTGRFFPKRGDPDLFERHAFITGVMNGFVEFSYHGWHQELFRQRITPDDVAWASELMAGLSDEQWADAFRAGGYEPRVADRFIRTLHKRIAEGLRVARNASRVRVFDTLAPRPAVVVH